MPLPLIPTVGDERTSKYSKKIVRKYIPTLQMPMSGQKSSTIRALGMAYMQEINNCKVELDKYKVMHSKDPTVRSCIEIKCLRAALAYGTYNNSNPRVEEWVRANLDNIKGSFKRVVGRLSGACAEGFRVAEIVYSNKLSGYQGQWRLAGFNILDSSLVGFEGKDGEIESIIYPGPNGEELKIPYWKCIHVINGFGLIDDDQSSVLGSPESRAAFPYYKAKQALLTEMVVAAKSNSSGVLIGKVDSNATVEQLDSRGEPIIDPNTGAMKTESAATSLLRQMTNLEQNGYLVTDKNNDISPLVTQTSEGFWSMAIELLDKGIRRAYGIPELIFSEGSSSIQFGSLGKQHFSVLDSQVDSIVVQIRDQMIEKVIKPLIVFNFGSKEDYGSFEATSELDPEQTSLKITNIVTAIQSGAISTTNLKVTNKLFELLGLASMTEKVPCAATYQDDG